MAWLRFAGSDPEDVWIGRSHGDVTNGERGLVLEDRHPCQAVVGCLPEIAGADPDVERVRLPDGNGNRFNPSAGHLRADGTPLQCGERRLGIEPHVCCPCVQTLGA